jgi:hypothetical protein
MFGMHSGAPEGGEFPSNHWVIRSPANMEMCSPVTIDMDLCTRTAISVIIAGNYVTICALWKTSL